MPRRKIHEEHAPKGEKKLWHPYDLQSLAQREFVRVVNKILQSEYAVMDKSHCASTLEV